MTDLHRRDMFGIMMGGAAVAAAGFAFTSFPAASAPLMTNKSFAAPAESLVEEAVVVVRRPRRRVCWWRRGRRVCTWR